MSLYKERWGLPGIGKAPKAPEIQKSPLVRELQRLAKLPGIVDHFLPTMEGFNPDRKKSQEVMKLLDWGRRYHRSEGISSTFHEARLRASHSKLMEVEVYVPTVTETGQDKRSVRIPLDAPKITANLLGIVGARYVGDGLGVIFDGVVVLKGDEAYVHNAMLVGIYSRTGEMFFHPDFLPNSGKIVKRVDDVIPPFRSTRKPGESQYSDE